MLRTSRDEALTDALTGLGNRRALARALDELLPQATAERPLVLALFDLDGFKHYNDTFGHPAGDALLVRLGAQPRAPTCDGRGRAFRMGGDEFCALFEPGGEVARPDASTAPRSALSEHGEGFSIGCSLRRDRAARARRPTPPRRCGSPTSACTRRSTPGRMSAARQSKDVLLRALAERDPDLGDHSERRRRCSPRRPRGALGLDADEVESVRHAAELHDVGKVAIPDAILAKPGPLTDERVGVHPPPHADRRADHRRRTGARAASRALVALQPRALGRRRLPRRPGGRGDPARRAHRRRRRRVRRDDRRPPLPRRARTPGRRSPSCARCAGTQFDPDVVDALCAAYTRRALAAV